MTFLLSVANMILHNCVFNVPLSTMRVRSNLSHWPSPAETMRARVGTLTSGISLDKKNAIDPSRHSKEARVLKKRKYTQKGGDKKRPGIKKSVRVCCPIAVIGSIHNELKGSERRIMHPK